MSEYSSLFPSSLAYSGNTNARIICIRHTVACSELAPRTPSDPNLSCQTLSHRSGSSGREQICGNGRRFRYKRS